MSQQVATNTTSELSSEPQPGRNDSEPSREGDSSDKKPVDKSGRIPSKAQLAFKRWRYKVFWKANLVEVGLYFYVPLFVFLGIIAWLFDQFQYFDFMLDIAESTSLRTSPIVQGAWKWGVTAAPLALAILSFSYTLVRDVSLSLVFTYNPIGKHLVALYACTLASGLTQMARSSNPNPYPDAFMGDLLFLGQFLAMLALSVWFVVDQFQRLAPTDEFRYCVGKINRFANVGLSRAKELGGKESVFDVLNLIQVHYETMFQVLGTFVQRDMDVYYEGYLNEVAVVTSRLVTAIQVVCRGQHAEYRSRIKFLSEKHFDHLLVLSQKHHGLEAKHLINDCFVMLRQAAAYDKHCLVQCSVPLRTSILTLVQRKERVTLMNLLGSYVDLYGDYRSVELSAAVLYLYYAVLVEAATSGDKVTLNELLHQLRVVENLLSRLQVRWLYTILWSAILKSIEHSAHDSTGALLKTFVTRFDSGRAKLALDRLLVAYGETKEIRPVKIPVSVKETLRDTRLRESLHALNPEYEFIQGSLDYCLTKMIFLWFGQQCHLIHMKATDVKAPVTPKHLASVHPQYLFYLRTKLLHDKYGLTWIHDRKVLDLTYVQLCKRWKVRPELLELPKDTASSRSRSSGIESVDVPLREPKPKRGSGSVAGPDSSRALAGNDASSSAPAGNRTLPETKRPNEDAVPSPDARPLARQRRQHKPSNEQP